MASKRETFQRLLETIETKEDRFLREIMQDDKTLHFSWIFTIYHSFCLSDVNLQHEQGRFVSSSLCHTYRRDRKTFTPSLYMIHFKAGMLNPWPTDHFQPQKNKCIDEWTYSVLLIRTIKNVTQQKGHKCITFFYNRIIIEHLKSCYSSLLGLKPHKVEKEEYFNHNSFVLFFQSYSLLISNLPESYTGLTVKSIITFLVYPTAIVQLNLKT